MAAPPHTCYFYTADGRRCDKRLRTEQARELGRCGTHERTYQTAVARYGPPLVGGCIIRIQDGWCGRVSEAGTHMCARHREGFARNAAARDRVRIVGAFYRDLRLPLRHIWHEAMRIIWESPDLLIHEKRDLSLRYWVDTVAHPTSPERLAVFTQLHTWYDLRAQGHLPPGPMPGVDLPIHVDRPRPRAPAAELGRIATDRQNVHTSAVSQQTNALQAKLLEKGGDYATRTVAPKRMVAMWLNYDHVSFANLGPLVTDMSRFYSLAMVRTPNDYLYRRLFNAVSAVIMKTEDAEKRKELIKRLAEECWESVGMCTEGHLTRLCNVFVGFDDAFVTPMTTREILQQKIAAIAGQSGLTASEKKAQAAMIFAELKVPDDERTSWIEALEAY